METLIGLIVAILIFCIAAWGLDWICTHFGFPPPVRWIVGAILLIILLYWIAGNLPPVAWPTFGHR